MFSSPLLSTLGDISSFTPWWVPSDHSSQKPLVPPVPHVQRRPRMVFPGKVGSIQHVNPPLPTHRNTPCPTPDPRGSRRSEILRVDVHGEPRTAFFFSERTTWREIGAGSERRDTRLPREHRRESAGSQRTSIEKGRCAT